MGREKGLVLNVTGEAVINKKAGLPFGGVRLFVKRRKNGFG